MDPSIILVLLGVLLMVIVVWLIFGADEVSLGKNSSRIIAVVFALIGYFYVLSNIPFLNIGPVTITLINWLVPVVLIALILFFGYLIYRDPDEEIYPVLRQSPVSLQL